MRLLMIFLIISQIVGTKCCIAPTYQQLSLKGLPVSALTEPGQVMHWIKDVNKMGETDIERLKRYIIRHGAVIIKGQKMTKDQHIALTKSLGTPVEVPNSFFMHGDDLKGNITVVPVSNYWYNGTWKGGKHSYGQYWHKDMNFLPEEKAHIFSIFYAKDYQQGEKGGTTGFIDACKARRELPLSLEKRIRGIKFKFGADLSGDYRKCATQSDLDYYGEVERSLIFLHPVRKCECINLAKTKYGFRLSESKKESLEAVEETWEWVQKRPYYQHIWTQGDIAIWDNFAVFHKLLPYIDEGKKRAFDRTYTRPSF